MQRTDFEKRDAWRDERVAASYERRRFAGFWGRRKQAHDERMVGRLLERAGRTRELGRVLDMPCGTGRLIGTLSARAQFVVGCDLSFEMLRAGAERAFRQARVVQGDGLRLPFASKAFDAVLCMRFLFHVNRRETRVAMLREMARVGSGLVIVQVRYRWTFKHGARWLRSRVGLSRRYRPADGAAGLASELSEAGLELCELRVVSRLFSDKALLLARSSSRDVAAAR